MTDCYNDEEIKLWVIKVREGDKSAFNKLFVKFYSPLCKFAWRYVRSSHISEELVQDAFLEVWELRASLDSDKSIKSYLYQIVRNRALNHLKHKSIAREHNKDIAWINSTPITQLHNFKEQSEFVRAAQKAIDELPDGARQIYKLSRKDGLTYREIAEVLDLSPKTVESQMSRALKILRRELSDYLTAEVKVPSQQ